MKRGRKEMLTDIECGHWLQKIQTFFCSSIKSANAIAICINKKYDLIIKENKGEGIIACSKSRTNGVYMSIIVPRRRDLQADASASLIDK